MINESRSQELSEEKFKEILYSKCNNWNLDNEQIYRGISRNYKPFLYINPKGHTRKLTYAEGTNIYTIIMENGPQWSKYPKRSESVIATNDWTFTSDYAEYDDEDNLLYHIVIPYDNTTWGITPKDDLWFAYDVDKLGLINLSEFNNIISNAIGVMRGVNRINVSTIADLKHILNQIDYNNKKHINDSIERLKQNTIMTEIKEFGEDTIIFKTLEGLKNSNNSSEALEVIMTSLKPEGFSLQTYDNQGIRFTRETQECWTDGECLMIRRDFFEKMFG